MSEYMNKKELFMEPETRQYGSHMIMTNVHKPQKQKYINIDTKFRDEYNYQETSNYNITLPERINDVKTITITNIEIPMTFYIISTNFGNNYFQVTKTGNTPEIIMIEDGNYTYDELATKINEKLSSTTNAASLTISIDTNKKSTITSSDQPNEYVIEFDVNSNGGNDKYNLKTKLGWLLGFRKSSYNITTNVISENIVNLNGPPYLYLAIDEYNKHNQNTFLSQMTTSIINKNIIARISLDRHLHPFGTILPATRYAGLLVSDTRTYTGKIDMQKINVQLLNEYGKPIILNGMDFSFCMEIVCE